MWMRQTTKYGYPEVQLRLARRRSISLSDDALTMKILQGLTDALNLLQVLHRENATLQSNFEQVTKKQCSVACGAIGS